MAANLPAFDAFQHMSKFCLCVLLKLRFEWGCSITVAYDPRLQGQLGWILRA